MYRCFTCFRVFVVPIVISETLRNILAEGNLFDGGLKFHMIKKKQRKIANDTNVFYCPIIICI